MFLILKVLHCENFTSPMFSNSNASNDLPKKCEKSIVYFFLFLLFLVVAVFLHRKSKYSDKKKIHVEIGPNEAKELVG